MDVIFGFHGVRMTVSHGAQFQTIEELGGFVLKLMDVSLLRVQSSRRDRDAVDARREIIILAKKQNHTDQAIADYLKKDRTLVAKVWKAYRLSVTCPTDAKSNERSR